MQKNPEQQSSLTAHWMDIYSISFHRFLLLYNNVIFLLPFVNMDHGLLYMFWFPMFSIGNETRQILIGNKLPLLIRKLQHIHKLSKLLDYFKSEV